MERTWKMKWKLVLYRGCLSGILFGDTMVPIRGLGFRRLGV